MKVLLVIVMMLKSGRAEKCDLSELGGSKNAGTYSVSSKLSNWKKKFKDVRIIDVSASGIYEKVSINLMELL